MDFFTLEDKVIARPEMSVQNYKSTLSNNPEERKSHLHRGGSLKSCTVTTETMVSLVTKVTIQEW
jgi:hypothetical protein